MSTYGSKLNTQEINRFLDFSFSQNEQAVLNGRRGTPICIWGTHGIGKTETIINFAKKRGYTTIYVAPAQFEEMGDLHGIPEVFNPHPELPNHGNELTVYRPPQWLKDAIHTTSDEPGVLILDDFNRADERILQGCMQLLQMHALFSWKLPANWQILLTANPETGDYKVTELDDAMLTRMLHVTMKFDATCWADWALSDGIDSRGVEFVMTYPEVIDGTRTTARSMTNFLRQVGQLSDYSSEDNLWLVRVIGEGTVDSKVVDHFIHFMAKEQSLIIQPKKILSARNFATIEKKLKQVVKGQGIKRNDILATICSRLTLYVMSKDYKFQALHKKNMIHFLLCEVMEASLRFSIHGAISNAKADVKKECGPLIQDAQLAQVILKSM